MTVPQNTSGLRLTGLAIDPAWLHIPAYAQKRDLGYPTPKVVNGY
jgi:hypothetical protein